ncbi:hypothetical protein WJX81_008083 [Elliptochloris bilobata]|uniref:ABC transporter domain-containing protein n=1 Tax=Elliptochloris bilobata TaxID=381761 RepID=A0AAW1RE19_9CHLO
MQPRIHPAESFDVEDGKRQSGHPADGLGMPIVIKDLTYTVANNANRRERLNLLESVSACLWPGQMTALMGPSGSGKTTLLDVLAGRKTTGALKGDVLFCGRPPTQAFLQRYTGYVEQFDTLLDNLTVSEMLVYTAELKRPLGEPRAAKRAAVEKLVSDLALEQCRHTVIGNQMHRGISGGQAKRVNIGIALVTTPLVLFLDEPTSGLDSQTAKEVMVVVKRLTETGLTTCATVHSPTPRTFALFDSMLLLLRGRTAYFGRRGEAAIDFFSSLPPGMTDSASKVVAWGEAEWIVEITTTANRQDKAAWFAAHYAVSSLAASNAAAIDALEILASGGGMEHEVLLREAKSTATPFFWGVYTMLKHRTSRNFADPAFLGPRIGDKFLFCFIIFTLYFGDGGKQDPGNVLNVMQMLFMWTLLPAFSAVVYVPAIVLERPLFMRERSDGLYWPVTYLVAKLIEEFAIVLVLSVVFAAIVFAGVNLHGSFLLFWMIYLVTLWNGIVLAYGIASLSPNMDFANAAVPAYTIALLFFAGYLVRLQDIPKYWTWFPHLNFIKYAFSAQMLNEYGGANNHPFQGASILEFYDFPHDKWVNLGLESLFLIAFFVLALLGLTFLRHSKR